MASKTSVKPNKKRLSGSEFESLYQEFVAKFYQEGDRAHAEKLAVRLEKFLEASSEISESIRGEEVRSLIAELRGNFAEAIQSREAEIRKILQLHALTANTSSWDAVSQRYDFGDVGDRLDLLAGLYDEVGQIERAIAVLMESKAYSAAHQIPFDGEDLLHELQQSRAPAKQKRIISGKN
jgi:hypothetical protein